MASLPDDVPGYRIVRVLGQGGMATVYLAMQESLGREVALKLLSERFAQDPEAASRFVREARTAARLVHRHIVGVHDVGTHEGRPYLAMEFLPGGTLPAGRMSPAEALRAIREIALALDHAHQQGVVHRDIKPENILRRADGSHALADFGIARTADSATVMTREGITLGTPHYMSPEQLQGKPIDGRSDLYSLGVVLYQLLTGALPYQGTDGWSIGVQHITAAIPQLPPELARYQPLVDRLMAKDPADRPQTGAEAAQLLESALAGITPAPAPVTVAAPAMPAARQRRMVVTLASLALLVFAGWAGWNLWGPGRHAGANAAAAASEATAVDRSIAVLPLANLGGKSENEYFSDGLAETVLDMLARSPDLRVIARSSSFAFKGKDVDVREIGKALGAAHLLQGSVQQSGDTVRIRAQLVRASDGAVLWSSQYDRNLADVFQIQDEVATEVVTALQGALPQAALTNRTANLAAYREYLKGNQLLRLRKVDDLREALRRFQAAIAIDPGFAGAYVGAANTLVLLETHVGLKPEELQACRRFVDKALALDPASGEAHIVRAALAQIDRDPATAEREYQRGLELAPSYATGWQWYGEFLSIDRGQMAEALPAIQRAVSLDPLAPIILTQLGHTYLALGRQAEADAVGDKLQRQFPNLPQGHTYVAELRAGRGDLAGALQASKQAIAADPSSARARFQRCAMMLEAGAFAQGDACRAALAAVEGTERYVGNYDALRALSRDDLDAAERQVKGNPNTPPWQRAWVLRMTGKSDEALALYGQLWPEWLAQPLGEPILGSPFDPVDVAGALRQAGRVEQAETLLRYVLDKSAGRPRPGINGRAFSDVFAHAMLGEYPQACAAMQAAAGEGFVNTYYLMATDRDLTGLRTHPCFKPAYARLEAEAQAHIRKAVAANAF